MFMDIKKRVKIALSNESGSLILEQAVIIGVFLLISVVLITLIMKFEEISTVKSGYSTTTGWFRTENVNGIKN